MCETIIMPGGIEVEKFDGEDVCLCGKKQSEILTMIVEHSQEIEIGDKLEIEHTPVGWAVSVIRNIYDA